MVATRTKELVQSSLPFASSKATPKATPKATSKATSSKSKPTPTKSSTDVCLGIKSEFASLIREGTKNHEYRRYKLRDTVKRLWLYEVTPVMAITTVIEVTKAKVPGEIQDPTGIGNDDFDAGKKVSKYGYGVKAVWKLKVPIKASEMRSRFGLAPPQSFIYMTEKVLEEVKLEDQEKLI
ncbi:hypothetical protein AN958_06877 [Leucoagaricus sp. SymC.cos]|nr:hypothetical protein AN958_06877 [Leucoagaricus sp. SymC.cos]